MLRKYREFLKTVIKLLTVLLLTSSLSRSYPSFPNDYTVSKVSLREEPIFQEYVEEIVELGKELPKPCRTDICYKDTVESLQKGEFLWPEITASNLVMLRCPFSFVTPVYANRVCNMSDNGTAYWMTSDYQEVCPDPPLAELLKITSRQLNEAKNTPSNTSYQEVYDAFLEDVLDIFRNYRTAPVKSEDIAGLIDFLYDAIVLNGGDDDIECRTANNNMAVAAMDVIDILMDSDFTALLSMALKTKSTYKQFVKTLVELPYLIEDNAEETSNIMIFRLNVTSSSPDVINVTQGFSNQLSSGKTVSSPNVVIHLDNIKQGLNGTTAAADVRITVMKNFTVLQNGFTVKIYVKEDDESKITDSNNNTAGSFPNPDTVSIPAASQNMITPSVQKLTTKTCMQMDCGNTSTGYSTTTEPPVTDNQTWQQNSPKFGTHNFGKSREALPSGILNTTDSQQPISNGSRMSQSMSPGIDSSDVGPLVPSRDTEKGARPLPGSSGGPNIRSLFENPSSWNENILPRTSQFTLGEDEFTSLGGSVLMSYTTAGSGGCNSGGRKQDDDVVISYKVQTCKNAHCSYTPVCVAAQIEDDLTQFTNVNCTTIEAVDSAGFTSCQCTGGGAVGVIYENPKKKTEGPKGIIPGEAKAPPISSGSLSSFLGFQYKRELEILGNVLGAVSMACLIATVASYALFRRTRRGTPTTILLNLCVALIVLSAILLTVSFVSDVMTTAGCTTINVLRYYLVFVTLLWNAVEAFNMYLMLVKVFGSNISKFVLKAGLIAWGIPAIMVAVNLAINDKAFHGEYVLQSADAGTCAYRCRLRKNTLYYGYIVPMAIIIVHNFIVFGFVLKVIYRQGHHLGKTERKNRLVQLAGAVATLVLLGAPWMFSAFGAIDANKSDDLAITEGVFQVIFVVFVNLQGLFIFLFHCARNGQVRQSWSSMVSRRSERSDTQTKSTSFLSIRNGSDCQLTASALNDRDDQMTSSTCPDYLEAGSNQEKLGGV